jgi:hypothetical protein
VAVKFRDRTMLNWAPGEAKCSILLPTGKWVSVSINAPKELEPYVRAMLEFRQWSLPREGSWAPHGDAQVL